MSGNHYELEKEMNRRQCDIERNGREAWKFQGGNGKTNGKNRGLIRNPFLVVYSIINGINKNIKSSKIKD